MRKRCAIYTRKSTDEGLDQTFNSLDAQREACEAYIVSQRHEGWTLVKKAYDDGGYSGGTIERPALQILLEDIRSGLVDVVVVYKIDRLTRSLADFAKMVEIFDKKGVSFVSVTQQFNTTSSMGRLTLNVLLSFAQFEREVTAERIRDKIAASKKKGLWMGGLPPLGYDIKDKKLVVNPAEGAEVRRLFEAYLNLGTTKALTIWAKKNGITTKVRRHADGRVRAGGCPFSRGNLHALLRYRTYIGEVVHKGKAYPGNHAPIVPRELWDQVQERLSASRLSDRDGNTRGRSLPFTGLLFDETGDRLTPVHARKQNRRYQYYVSTRLIEGDSSDPSGWRLPARVLEQAVVEGIISFLRDDHEVIQAAYGHDDGSAAKEPHVLNQTLKCVRQLSEKIQQSDSADRLRILLPTIEHVVVASGELAIHIKGRALMEVAGMSPSSSRGGGFTNAVHVTRIPFELKRRGVETRLVIGAGPHQNTNKDINLIRTIARARVWFEDLRYGSPATINDIAARDKIPASEVSRQLPLAFLSPSIVEAILEGRQPVDLTAKIIQRRVGLPRDWVQQAKFLGFRTP